MRRSSPARPSVVREDALFLWTRVLVFLVLVGGLPGGLGSRWAFAQPLAEGALPLIGPRSGYVTSEACRDCHPDEHASWWRSYHHTMTQLASSNSFLGKFDGTSVEAEGLLYRVFQQGTEYWAEMPDPDLMMYAVQTGSKRPLTELPRVRRPVVMSTGSHHYQTYWVSSTRHPTVLHTLPLVYLLDEHRWIPRAAAFLHGPDYQRRFEVQWNGQCIRCHSTGGNPGLNESTGQLSTQVAEMGIACEACHGPGARHVEKQLATKAKSRSERKAKGSDDTIVHPAKLDSKAATEICGQCHGEYITREEYAMEAARHGPLYQPGGDLHRTRYYIQHPRPGSARQRWVDMEKNPDFFRERWWPDGTILAGGREFTALRASACFLKGKISCLNCHSMHESDPNDQLKPAAMSSKVCLECHREPKYTSDLTRHTFHAPGSAGNDCLNCHMPHTSYALLKGIRSHQISSPRLDSTARLGVPNACNLCHLDRTLAWTADHLASRYGQRSASLSDDDRSIAASVLWTLKGDAAHRAISSWHYGWPLAQQTSGTNWMVPILAPLLDDSYGVVRLIASRSLRSIAPPALAGYDFLGNSAHRRQVVSNALTAWRPSTDVAGIVRSNVLVSPKGESSSATIQRLLREQDRRSVTIQE